MTSPASPAALEFRFRPRFGALAWATLVAGAAFATASAALGWGAFGIGGGAIGSAFGGLYLLSPAWRYRARVDDDGLEVIDGRGDRRFRLAWREVVRCVASPSTKTCVVDGGSPGRTLIVPGEGAPAPYDIEDKTRLYGEIVARVPPDKLETVASLAEAR